MDEITEKQEEATRIIEAFGTTTLNECYVSVINLVCRMCNSEIYKNDDGQFVCCKCGYIQ
jgi:hypothetical protein